MMKFEEMFPSIVKDLETNPTSNAIFSLYDNCEIMEQYLSERLMDKQRVREAIGSLPTANLMGDYYEHDTGDKVEDGTFIDKEELLKQLRL